jgi:hypothetical protein
MVNERAKSIRIEAEIVTFVKERCLCPVKH